MAKQQKGLGRGLGALLKDPENDIKSVTDKNADKVVGHIVELELSSIEVNPNQPRTVFNEDALQELASSIKELGVIQPITVRKVGFDKYQLISGERRWRASKIAGLETVPAYIRLANDEESLMMALVENIQREDLDPIEVALSYQRMIEELNLTQEQMSERVGKKRSTITNYLRLLKLSPIIQNGMRDGFISMGHGRAITSMEGADAQVDVFNKIIAQGLSVRQTEQLVQGIKLSLGEQESKSKPVKASMPEFVRQSVANFQHLFQAKVSVKFAKNGAGKLEIPFSSEEDFKRIQKLLERD